MQPANRAVALSVELKLLSLCCAKHPECRKMFQLKLELREIFVYSQSSSSTNFEKIDKSLRFM